MPITCDSAASLFFDATLATPDEKGHGAPLRPSDVDWAYTNIKSTSDKRGFFLDSYQNDKSWFTDTSGYYGRKQLADFTAYKSDLTTLGGWSQTAGQAGSADYWLTCEEAGGKLVTTGSSWTGGSGGLLRANPHLHIRAFCHGIPDTNGEILELSWGTKYQLIVYGNGTALLYDSSAGITLASDVLFRRGSIVHEPIHFRIVPLFRRCVYLFAGGGMELFWEDLELDESTTDHTAPDAASPLVPEGTWTIRAYDRLSVQPTEVAYKATGQMDATVRLPYKPSQGVQFVAADGSTLHRKDAPGDSSVTVSAPGFVADGTMDTMAVRAAFVASTDQRSTPVLYSPGYRFEPTTQEREHTDTEVLPVTMPDTTLEVDEESTRLTLHLKESDSLRSANNRLVVMKLDGTDEEFRGFASDPEWDEDSQIGDVQFQVEDEMSYLNGILMPNTYDFGGLKVTDVMKQALSYAGVGSDRYDIQDSNFHLPKKGANQARGDHEAQLKPGTGVSVGEWLRYLRDTYSDWALFWDPVSGVRKLRFRDFSTVASPTVTLYRTNAAALAAGKDYRYHVMEAKWKTLKPEANEIHVFGKAQGGKFVHSVYQDRKSQDATLADEDRPANWLGTVRQIIVIDAAIATIEQANLTARWIANRTTRAVRMGLVRTHWHPQVHRYDTMAIHADASYQVKSYRMTMTREEEVNGKRLRPCLYRLERVL